MCGAKTLVLAFAGRAQQRANPHRYLVEDVLSMTTVAWGLLSLKGVALEEVDIVVGVIFISCNCSVVVDFLYVLHSLMTLALLSRINFNKYGCVHHIDAEDGDFNLLFERKKYWNQNIIWLVSNCLIKWPMYCVHLYPEQGSRFMSLTYSFQIKK